MAIAESWDMIKRFTPHHAIPCTEFEPIEYYINITGQQEDVASEASHLQTETISCKGSYYYHRLSRKD